MGKKAGTELYGKSSALLVGRIAQVLLTLSALGMEVHSYDPHLPFHRKEGRCYDAQERRQSLQNARTFHSLH